MMYFQQKPELMNNNFTSKVCDRNFLEPKNPN